MSHEDFLSQDEKDALKAKFAAPQRETSEMSDLLEIETLLSTQRQADEKLAKIKESLQARLDLLEEAAAGVRSQKSGGGRQKRLKG